MSILLGEVGGEGIRDGYGVDCWRLLLALLAAGLFQAGGGYRMGRGGDGDVGEGAGCGVCIVCGG